MKKLVLGILSLTLMSLPAFASWNVEVLEPSNIYNQHMIADSYKVDSIIKAFNLAGYTDFSEDPRQSTKCTYENGGDDLREGSYHSTDWLALAHRVEIDRSGRNPVFKFVMGPDFNRTHLGTFKSVTVSVSTSADEKSIASIDLFYEKSLPDTNSGTLIDPVFSEHSEMIRVMHCVP